MRCSLLRPKWRTTGRVWVRRRRTLLGCTPPKEYCGFSSFVSIRDPLTCLVAEFSLDVHTADSHFHVHSEPMRRSASNEASSTTTG